MVSVGQSRLATIVSMGQSLVCPLVVLALLWPLGLTGLWLNMGVSTLATTVLSLFVLSLFRRTARERMVRA
jgi:Na+-driven multidrug efflux pump